MGREVGPGSGVDGPCRLCGRVKRGGDGRLAGHGRGRGGGRGQVRVDEGQVRFEKRLQYEGRGGMLRISCIPSPHTRIPSPNIHIPSPHTRISSPHTCIPSPHTCLSSACLLCAIVTGLNTRSCPSGTASWAARVITSSVCVRTRRYATDASRSR